MVVLEVEEIGGRVKTVCWGALTLYHPLDGFKPEVNTPIVLVPEGRGRNLGLRPEPGVPESLA